jgi:hypothetical protein
LTGAAGRRRLALLFCAFGLLALTIPAANAQTELLPGDVPAPEIVENPVKRVKQAVGQLQDKADKVVTDTVDTVEKVTEETTKKVEETVAEVERTVDEVKKQVDRVVDGVIGGSDRPAPNTDEPRARNNAPEQFAPEVEDGDSVVRSSRVRAPFGTQGSQSPAADSLLTTGDANVEISARAAERASGDVSPAPTPGEIARQLLIPILMTLAVLAYLMLQGRFDRRDPKMLFHADLDGDRLGFD